MLLHGICISAYYFPDNNCSDRVDKKKDLNIKNGVKKKFRDAIKKSLSVCILNNINVKSVFLYKIIITLTAIKQKYNMHRININAQYFYFLLFFLSACENCDQK